MEKRCIFHIPLKINVKMASASQLRPLQMIQAFKDNGYVVDVVEGSAKERKESINKIKENIKNGVKYDFMYSESSTMPTLLTESHHLPTHPFLDFSFFKFIKKHDIKIGLFYRDMYWKFPGYGETLSKPKKMLAIFMYKHDLKAYNKYVDVIYLSTDRCQDYLKEELMSPMFEALPPGCNILPDKKKMTQKEVTLFYVGGISGHYRMHDTLKVISEVEGIKLILCCRKSEWENEKEHLEKYVNDNILVVHKSGKELEELYKSADVGLLLLEPDEYISMAMPYKTFEYMGHGLPIIASKHTAVGDMVNDLDVGWDIAYGSEEELKELIELFVKDRTIVDKKIENVMVQAEKNTWKVRALKVKADLT